MTEGPEQFGCISGRLYSCCITRRLIAVTVCHCFHGLSVMCRVHPVQQLMIGLEFHHGLPFQGTKYHIELY